MKLFHLDSSIREQGSVSREVAATFRSAWQEANQGGSVTYRDLVTSPVPHLSVSEFVGAQTPEKDRTAEQAAALRLSEELVGELRAADAYLISSPLYNWGIPSSLKAWVDHVMLDRGLAGEEPALAGRPAVLVMAKGGAYGPGTPREGWDYGEPYLRRVLADVMRLDLEVIVAELTLAGVVPALAHLQHLADSSLAEAHSEAERHALRLVASSAA